jgi:cell division protein FtsQ
MSKRALAQQDQAAQSVRNKKVSRMVMLMVAILLSALALMLLLADQMLRPDAFMIDQLKIKGRFVHLKPQTIEQTVLRHKTGNFFSVNLNEIQQQVELMRWVDTAEVRREWPNTLTVSVVEHRPIMQINDNAWVNIRGQVVDLPEYSSPTPVIKLHGDANQAKSMMVKALQWTKRFEDFSLSLREISLSQSGAWILRVRYMDDVDSANQDEFTLLLGDNAIDERLTRFEQLFDRQFRFSKDRLIRADARYPDGIAVKTKSVTSNTSHNLEFPVKANLVSWRSNNLERLFYISNTNSFARSRAAASA